MEHSEIEYILQNCEFFEGVEKSYVHKIAKLCQVADYGIGDHVFQQGDFGENLYIIAEGQIFLERSVNLGTRKGNVVIETLGKGRVLGCWSTLLDESHILMSSGICQKPTKVLVLKGSDLRKVMLENPELGINIFEKFCFLLRDRIKAAYGALEKI